MSIKQAVKCGHAQVLKLFAGSVLPWNIAWLAGYGGNVEIVDHLLTQHVDLKDIIFGAIHREQFYLVDRYLDHIENLGCFIHNADSENILLYLVSRCRTNEDLETALWTFIHHGTELDVLVNIVDKYYQSFDPEILMTYAIASREVELVRHVQKTFHVLPRLSLEKVERSHEVRSYLCNIDDDICTYALEQDISYD